MPAGPVTGCWAAGVWADTVWEVGVWASAIASLLFVLDLNTRMRVYLADLYSLPATTDLTAMIARYLRSQTGDMNARFHKLITDATAAMT
jgi:hypothetical protein